jgi:hypothetical protein
MKRKVIYFLGLLVALATVLPSEILADSTPSGTASAAGSSGAYNSGGADDPAVSFTGVTTNFSNGSWSLGWEFSTNTAINVSALGFYDATLSGGSVGLGNCSGCGEVGIYDSTGTLLVSGLVNTLGTQVGDFFYVSVPTTLLGAGQNYYVAAETGNADYTWNPTGFGVDPNINYLTARIYSVAPWPSQALLIPLSPGISARIFKRPPLLLLLRNRQASCFSTPGGWPRAF